MRYYVTGKYNGKHNEAIELLIRKNYLTLTKNLIILKITC